MALSGRLDRGIGPRHAVHRRAESYRVLDRQAEIERGIGILKHHLRLAAQLLDDQPVARADAEPVEDHLALVRRQQMHQQPRRRRLAAAGFAYDAEHLSGAHLKGAEFTALYGLYSLSLDQLSAIMIGEQQDYCADISRIKEIWQEEIVHELVQEIARSNIRNIDQGKAGRGRVLLPVFSNASGIIDRLKADNAFPGCTIIHRPDLEVSTSPLKSAAKKRKETKAGVVGRTINSTLAEMPDTVSRAAFKAVKPLVESRVRFPVTQRIWQEALELYTGRSLYRVGVYYPTGQRADTTWKIEGRSFVRMVAADFGFATG